MQRNSHCGDVLDFDDWQKGKDAHQRAAQGPCRRQERVITNETQSIDGGPENGQREANGEDLPMEVGLDLNRTCQLRSVI